MGQAWSKDRLAPMLRDTPALRGKVAEARSRDGENTVLHKKFAGGHITVAAANAPSGLASLPIRFVLLDEVDRYPASAGLEGDPVGLAVKRTATLWNRKILTVSSPTVSGASRIEIDWEHSDQRHFWVPCPDCGEHQTLKWQQIVWDDGKPQDAVYKCEHCGLKIPQYRKQWMLARCEWRAEFPGEGRPAGFHLNELYSPWRNWGDTAVDFLAAKKSPETLRTWVNTALGETWAEAGEAPDWQRLYDRRENYAIGTVLRGVFFLTAGADVQKDRIEYIVLDGNTSSLA
jgi:phage terminase large subunit GpA-like protein